MFARSFLTGNVFLLVFAVQVASAAERAAIRFDVANMITCRDVTSPGFAAANPHERLVEARVQVSVLSELRPEHSLTELLIRIESPDRVARVFDYFPKTTLASAYVGPLEIEQRREKTRAVEVGAQAQSLVANAGSKMSEQETSSYHEHGQKLPPMDLMSASGTVQRGAGVYFKLRPSPRTAIEGGQDFVIVLRVPDDWRADLLVVHCEAFGEEANLLNAPSRVRWSDRSFVVAIHREGDAVAKQRAAWLLRTEWELRTAADQHRRQLEKQSRIDPLRELETLFKKPQPKLPENWLDQILFASEGESIDHVQRQLPEPIRIAVLNYRDAKRQLHRLGQQPTAAHVVAKPVVAANTAKEPERLPPVQ